MNNNRLGCLTGSGFIAGGLTLLIIAVISFTQGGVLFSPGALNAQAGQTLGGVTSHAEIGGQCKLCHAPFWSAETMADRCMDCHIDVAAQRGDPSALHGVLFANDPNFTCRSCHPDHRGANAPLTDMDNARFPHEATGFSLNGHQVSTDGSPFSCNDCHTAGYTSFDQTTCQTCHNTIDTLFTTAHILSFGTDCLVCHDGIDTYGSDFDHNIYPFQLIGKHAEADCSGCHLNAHSIPDLQSAPQDCYACHAEEDAHEGRFGTDCGACHTPEGWQPAAFDHNLSAFKLEGKHADVPCESCHIDHVFIGTPTDCYSCHAADDKHNGSYGTDCAACHTPAGWLPATVDHSLFAFKLDGAHASVPCESCHINNVFVGTPSDCYSCHAADDAHAGSFGIGCGSCHTTSGWLPATFDHASFPLTGGHAGLQCIRCHTTSGIYTGLSTSCVFCHAEPAYHFGVFGTNCASCHTTSNWNATYTGSHPNTCDGQCINHEGASCRDCHTVNLSSATCTKCHDSNNPKDDD